MLGIDGLFGDDSIYKLIDVLLTYLCIRAQGRIQYFTLGGREVSAR